MALIIAACFAGVLIAAYGWFPVAAAAGTVVAVYLLLTGRAVLGGCFLAAWLAALQLTAALGGA